MTIDTTLLQQTDLLTLLNQQQSNTKTSYTDTTSDTAFNDVLDNLKSINDATREKEVEINSQDNVKSSEKSQKNTSKTRNAQKSQTKNTTKKSLNNKEKDFNSQKTTNNGNNQNTIDNSNIKSKGVKKSSAENNIQKTTQENENLQNCINTSELKTNNNTTNDVTENNTDSDNLTVDNVSTSKNTENVINTTEQNTKTDFDTNSQTENQTQTQTQQEQSAFEFANNAISNETSQNIVVDEISLESSNANMEIETETGISEAISDNNLEITDNSVDLKEIKMTQNTDMNVQTDNTDTAINSSDGAIDISDFETVEDVTETQDYNFDNLMSQNNEEITNEEIFIKEFSNTNFVQNIDDEENSDIDFDENTIDEVIVENETETTSTENDNNDINVTTKKDIDIQQDDDEDYIQSNNELAQMIDEVEIDTDDVNLQQQETQPTQVKEDLTETLLKAQITGANQNTASNQAMQQSNNQQSLEQALASQVEVQNVDTNVQTNTQTNLNFSQNNNNSTMQSAEISSVQTFGETNSTSETTQPFSNEISKLTQTASKIQNTASENLNKTDILNQIANKFEALKDNTTSKVNIILRPENLGKIGVELVSRPDGVTARMLADTQQIKELLDKNLDTLKASLQNQGVNVNNITVKVVESSQNTEMNFAQNFDFNNQQQEENKTLSSEMDNDFKHSRSNTDEEDEENDILQSYQKDEENDNELQTAERLYKQHSGLVDLIV